MSESEASARAFTEALVPVDRETLHRLLEADAALRVFTWEGDGAHRPATSAIEALAELAAPWLANSLEFFTVTASGDSAAVQFRTQAREGHLPVDQNGGLFFSFAHGLIASVDLHLARPMPAATARVS